MPPVPPCLWVHPKPLKLHHVSLTCIFFLTHVWSLPPRTQVEDMRRLRCEEKMQPRKYGRSKESWDAPCVYLPWLWPSSCLRALFLHTCHQSARHLSQPTHLPLVSSSTLQHVDHGSSATHGTNATAKLEAFPAYSSFLNPV